MGSARKLLQKTNKIKQKITQKHQQISTPATNHVELKENKLPKPLPQQRLLSLDKFQCNSVSLKRIDFNYPYKDYGLELTVPPGIITASGIGSGDIVEILEGTLEGRSIEIIDVINLTTLRLDDYSTLNQTETGIKVKFVIN